jgi:hypothetical protein
MEPSAARPCCIPVLQRRCGMRRGILLWLIGVPIPVIILLALFWR